MAQQRQKQNPDSVTRVGVFIFLLQEFRFKRLSYRPQMFLRRIKRSVQGAVSVAYVVCM